MKQNYVEAVNAYKKISEVSTTYGSYHKTIFHLHTPQSHDYKLKAEWGERGYYKSKEKDIINLCISENIFPEEFDFSDFKLEGEFSIFSSTKELWAFSLLGNALLEHGIELVIVSDHNSIKGIKKLKKVIRHLYESKSYEKYTNIISGIEISCADKLHVVGIFELKEDNCKKVESWLENHLINEKEGTYKTSIDVIDFFDSIGGVAYIAHINTADIYKDGRYLSGGYKRTLFSSPLFNIVGVRNEKHIDKVSSFLSNYTNKKYNFVLDNDSHDIDSVSENVFWVKGSKIDHNMLIEALHDFDVSISLSEVNNDRKYIKGMYISYTNEGFLTNGDEPFVMRFSDALNCIIGGRGTGKSSILKMLDYIMAQRVDSENELDFLCKHGNAWVLYEDNGKEYIIEMDLPFKEAEDENILKYFGQNRQNYFRYHYVFNEYEVQEYTRKRYLSIYEVIHENSEVKMERKNSINGLLNDFYDVYYSVNNLVRTASSDEINSFIFNILFKNQQLSRPSDAFRFRTKSGILRMINVLDEKYHKRKLEVLEVIQSFNESQDGKLRIEYSNDEMVDKPEFEKWIFGRQANPDKYFKSYNINEDSVIGYIWSIYDDIGFNGLIKLTLDSSHIKDRRHYKLIPYTDEYTQQLVDNGIKQISEDNENDVVDMIFTDLITELNAMKIIDYLKSVVDKREKFSLKFNVNSKESVKVNSPIYKDVLELSLGQKAVAMLDFILGYGEYIHDYRPLIIDQPEDNLDSRYIYKNLVEQIRKTKEQRQIIMATHNATIVTNAMADLVCVMESDGNHGWITTSGYPSERRIKKHIINHLEGGIESFKHKQHVYGDVL